MAVKALVYIILSVFCIIMAVVLFSRLWNVFIGDDAVNNDVDLLAGRIEAIIKEQGDYVQKPFLLQSEDKIVIGFDLLETALTVDGYEYKKPDNCKSLPCICVTEKNEQVKGDTCETIDNTRVFFATDYTGQQVQITAKPKGGDSVFNDFNVAGTTHTGLVLARWYGATKKMYIPQAGQYVTVPLSSAIVPYVIEKYKVPGKDAYIITLIPQTGRQHERAFALRVCPEEVDDVRSEAACIGKTGEVSYKENGQRFCAVNMLTQTCRLIEMPACPRNQPVSGLCNCEGTVQATGTCGAV